VRPWQMRDPEVDAEFVNDIAPSVLGVLETNGFFKRLDDLFSPIEPSHDGVLCVHSFEWSEGILRDLGMDSDDIADVLSVLQLRGACCDCEILYNVVDENRFKSKYWKLQAQRFSAPKDQSQPTRARL
jgi:hypothetical protein